MMANPAVYAAASYSPIRYANGGVLLPQADLTVPNGDFFSHVRFYCNQSSDSYAGPVGYNWWVGSMPTVVASGTSVAVVFDPNNPYWFDQSGSDYVPRYGVVGVTLVEDTGAQTLTFTRTVNGLLEVTIFNDFTVWPNPGGLVSHTDWRGITSTATFNTDGTTAQLSRSFTAGSTTITETLLYAYYASGSSSGQLQTVTLQRTIGSGSPAPIQQVAYDYYGASDANGNLNDLQSASQQLPDGIGGWNTVGTEYYRYWLGTESTGIPHGLKMHFGPEAYRLLLNTGVDMETAADSLLLPFADHYFEYDPSTARVTMEIAAVCPGCPGGGTTADLFGFAINPRGPAFGYNTWAMKTIQTLPDSSQIIVYCNFAGMPMLKVIIDPTAANQWITAYIYNSDGQLIWTAQPSAVNGYDDSNDDLLNFDSGTSLYEYLNTTAGLINVTNYYTTTGSGAVIDYVQNENVRQGQSGGDILLRSYTYTSNIDSAGNAVYPVATDVSYPNASDTSITITTSYAYTFYSGTNIMSQKTTTVPVISTGQNGSGATYTTVENYDAYGNTTGTVDERGIVNSFTMAGPILGAVTEQVLNVQSGVTAPGVNVTADFTYDNQGRLIQTLGPTHTVVIAGTATTVRNAMFYVYIQSIQPTSGTWAPDQTLTGQGYATGAGPSYTYNLINPVTLTNTDKDGRTTDQITSVRTTGSGALSPTDTFAQTDWQTWTNIQYDNQHRTIGQSVYFLIPSSGAGTVGTNFGQTTFGYDALERRNRNVAAGGTITRTVWTTPQWVASVWVGTNDTGATDSDPTGGGAAGNNMVQIAANQYDGGSAGGDGNLTQQTQYVSATSGDTRVTAFAYDFRDRQISMTDATNRYAAYTYDNLDRQTQVQSFATSGGNLYAQSQTNYDDRSRVYQTLTYAVDPSTGTVGNPLTGNLWYDPSGNVLQQLAQGDGKAFTKSSYNGVNWVTSAYRGYNTSGTSYSQAATVAGDIIVEQTDNTYNEVGGLVSDAMSQRLNDVSTSTTGALTSSIARISYMASWFDGVDRTIASANYGAITSFTRPSTPPASSSTILVTAAAYDDAGRAYQVTDPMGYVAQTSYDNANRTTQTVEAYGSSTARTTNYAYTLDNLVASMTAANPTTGDQTTFWLYGTALADSGVARNDLLRITAYPGASLSWSTLGVDDWANLTVDQWAALTTDPDADHCTQVTYNRLGEQATVTDQRGTVRTFTRDKLGRQTDDGVTTVGSDTDNAVLRISRAYEIRGMVSTITSADNATPGSGTILNQVQLTYNSFGQLTKDQQEHSGAVSGTTPSVQYGYDSGASSSNEIRLNQLTYPNGRTIAYSFGSTGGMSDYLNRVDAINDTSGGTTTLAQYLYLGAGTVIRITYPEPSIWLDLWGGTSGTFNGIDQFNRIIDQRWQNSITGTPTDIDRYQYGYDQNSNRLWKANVVGTAAVTAGLDELYAYDPLNRLTDMQRGVLNSTKTAITGTPSVEQGWTLDLTGNWSNFTTKSGGTTNLNQTRTANSVNEITNITESTGPTWIVPAYDAAGNTITMPQPATPTSGFTAVYDAWNRMVSISAGSTVGKYQYDGRGFRIVKLTYTSGTLSETRDFFFTSGWQDIEERVSGSMVEQYVWGARYIDELVCRDDSTPQRLYVCQDANFNLTSITDTSGSVAERYLFVPYGSRTIMDSSWAAISSSTFGWVVGHQGLMHEPESGSIYNRLRPNDGALSTFASRDLAQYADGPSLYLVERANPIRFLDPIGLDIYIYFWDTTQSPSGAGHTAVGVGTACHQFFYEAYPSHGDNSPMGQPFYQSGSIDTVIAAASEGSRPKLTLQFSTTNMQDALALAAIAKWFHLNPNWSAEHRTDCADLDQAALAAAGLPTYPLGPFVSTPEQLSRQIRGNPASGAERVQGNWTAYNWQSGIFGVATHFVGSAVGAGLNGIGSLLSGIGRLAVGKCDCPRKCKRPR
jgi:RHS repeat-associated protein